MQSELSFFYLVLNASPLVQLVMASLMLASVISWTMIFDRSRVLKKARKAAGAIKSVLDTRGIAKHMSVRGKRTLRAAVRELEAKALAVRLLKKP